MGVRCVTVHFLSTIYSGCRENHKKSKTSSIGVPFAIVKFQTVPIRKPDEDLQDVLSRGFGGGSGCNIPRVNYWRSFLCAEVDALNDSHSVVIRYCLPAAEADAEQCCPLSVG